MTIPQKYPLTTEQSIASYDYFDIAEGTGIKTFYGMKQNMSGSSVFALTGNVLPSSDVETTGTTTTTTYNFNLTPFNLPKIIKGDALVSFSGMLDTSGGSSGDIWFGIQFQKVSGGTTTNISSEILTQTIARGSAGTTIQGFNLTIPLTTTKFKIGDNLRMVFKDHSVSANQIAVFAHDPENRAGTKISNPSVNPTTMKILIPFKLNVE